MNLRIVTTGGTIDKIYFDANSQYQVGEPVIGALLASMGVGFTFTVQSAMRKDSLEMTAADRAAIRSICEGCEEEYLLITHGTDSMVATALSLMGITGKRIVLTGALQPAAFRETDAIFNIGCALGAVQSLTPGVYIAMNGEIFAADQVIKNVAANRFERLS